MTSKMSLSTEQLQLLVNLTTSDQTNWTLADNTTTDRQEEAPDPRLNDLFLTFGYVVPIICVFGIIGNALSLLVLREKRFNTVMYVYVRWMSACDLFAMVLVIPQTFYMVFPNYYSHDYNTTFYFSHISQVMINTFLGTSTLLIVNMSVERWLSVCYPLRAKRVSTNVCAYVCVFMAATCCLASYIPMSFEYRVMVATWGEGNTTTEATYFPDWQREYASHYLYRDVYSWSRAALLRFLPFAAVLILNTCTLVGYRAILKRRRKLVIRKKNEAKQIAEENNRMIIMACTAVIFVVCLSPMPVAHVLRLLLPPEQTSTFEFETYMVVGNCLEILNAALNFYMYCLASRDFRKNLRKALRDLGHCMGIHTPMWTSNTMTSMAAPSPPTTKVVRKNGSFQLDSACEATTVLDDVHHCVCDVKNGTSCSPTALQVPLVATYNGAPDTTGDVAATPAHV